MPIDMSLQGAPPKKTTARAKNAPPVAAPEVSMMGSRAEAVNGIFQLGQGLLLMTGQYADAAAVGIHGPNISTELVRLADTNERVGRAIDFLITAGPYAGIVTATLPLVLQIATNHNRIPQVGIPGIVHPDALKAQMEAEVQMQAAAAMQQALEAQQMAQRVQADLDAASSANGREKPAQSRAGGKETPAK